MRHSCQSFEITLFASRWTPHLVAFGAKRVNVFNSPLTSAVGSGASRFPTQRLLGFPVLTLCCKQGVTFYIYLSMFRRVKKSIAKTPQLSLDMIFWASPPSLLRLLLKRVWSPPLRSLNVSSASGASDPAPFWLGFCCCCFFRSSWCRASLHIFLFCFLSEFTSVIQLVRRSRWSFVCSLRQAIIQEGFLSLELYIWSWVYVCQANV